MYALFDDSFCFGEAQNTPLARRRESRDSVSSPLASFNNRRREAMERITNYYRQENERLRKPCPTCNTLVKPELQKQHNTMYHPKKTV